MIKGACGRRSAVSMRMQSESARTSAGLLKVVVENANAVAVVVGRAGRAVPIMHNHVNHFQNIFFCAVGSQEFRDFEEDLCILLIPKQKPRRDFLRHH